MESYLNRCARVRVSVRSFTATKSRSATPCSFAALRTCRPIRPNPLMPTLVAMSPELLRLQPVAACAGPAKCHVADYASAARVKHPGALVESRGGGHDVVHQHDVLPADSAARPLDELKRTCNVAHSLLGCQLRLRTSRARPHDDVRPDGNFPTLGEGHREQGALIVSALSRPRAS